MENTDELFASTWFKETKERLDKINCFPLGGRVILSKDPFKVKWYLDINEKEPKHFINQENGEPDGMYSIEADTFEEAQVIYETKLVELGV